MTWAALWFLKALPTPAPTEPAAAGDSPFPPNATITFQVPIAGTEGINGLGSPSAELEPFEVQAYLKKVGWRGQALDDIDLSRVQVKGRCVSPGALPASLKAGNKGAIVAGDLVGEFVLESSLRGPTDWGIEEALGNKIEGYIMGDAAWGDAL